MRDIKIPFILVFLVKLTSLPFFSSACGHTMADYEGQVGGEPTTNEQQSNQQQYVDAVSQQQQLETTSNEAQAVIGGDEDQQQQEQIHYGAQDPDEGDDIMDTQPPPLVQYKCQVVYDEHKIFIGGLHPATKQKDLEDYFSKYGKLTEVNQKFDPCTNQSRGYAFLVYEESSSVDKVLEDCPHTIDDKIVDVKKAIPHEVHQRMKHRTKKVFVGGVPVEMPQETITSYFKRFGEIEEVALVTEKSDPSKRRGFVFVTFVSEDCADKACAKDKQDLDGHKIEVKRATPKEQNNKVSQGSSQNFMTRGRGHYPSVGGRGHQFTPYGGHAVYYSYCPPPPMYNGGGSYMGGGGGYNGAYGGYGGYGGAFDNFMGGSGGGRRDDAYNSRYGPMRSNYGHGHSHTHVHPYSR